MLLLLLEEWYTSPDFYILVPFQCNYIKWNHQSCFLLALCSTPSLVIVMVFFLIMFLMSSILCPLFHSSLSGMWNQTSCLGQLQQSLEKEVNSPSSIHDKLLHIQWLHIIFPFDTCGVKMLPRLSWMHCNITFSWGLLTFVCLYSMTKRLQCRASVTRICYQ